MATESKRDERLVAKLRSPEYRSPFNDELADALEAANAKLARMEELIQRYEVGGAKFLLISDLRKALAEPNAQCQCGHNYSRHDMPNNECNALTCTCKSFAEEPSEPNDDPLNPDSMTSEAVSAELRKLGGNPTAIGERGAKLAADLIAKHSAEPSEQAASYLAKVAAACDHDWHEMVLATDANGFETVGCGCRYCGQRHIPSPPAAPPAPAATRERLIAALGHLKVTAMIHDPHGRAENDLSHTYECIADAIMDVVRGDA